MRMTPRAHTILCILSVLAFVALYGAVFAAYLGE